MPPKTTSQINEVRNKLDIIIQRIEKIETQLSQHEKNNIDHDSDSDSSIGSESDVKPIDLKSEHRQNNLIQKRMRTLY